MLTILSALLSIGFADEGLIHCAGQANGDKITLTITKFYLKFQRGVEPPEKYTLTAKQVKGVGESSRTIFKYGKKYISFHDRYGCVDNLEMPEKVWGFKTEALTCTREGQDCSPKKKLK